MRVFFLLTGIIELLAGLGLFLLPSAVPEFKGADDITMILARLYGAAAISLGLFALLAWQKFDNAEIRDSFLKMFVVFHVLVVVATFPAFSGIGFSNPGAPILHLVMALITLYFLVQERRRN